MAQAYDPGLTQKVTGALRRMINPDGTFNVRRRGAGLRDLSFYLYLVEASWPKFFFLVFMGYGLVNCLFALVYMAQGAHNLQGTETGSAFFDCFFFSVHTLTTVGYGNLAPRGLAMNAIAAIEAMLGLMGFAVATGLLFARFSRPSARILFSGSMLVAPYEDRQSLQFRIANGRRNELIDLEAKVLLMTVTMRNGQSKRNYDTLKLERPMVHFFPLTWTVVHVIDESSPLHNISAEQMAELQTEFLISIKAFDETFSQGVHSRYSYRHDELLWNTRFAPAFDVDSDGKLIVDLKRLSDVQKA